MEAIAQAAVGEEDSFGARADRTKGPIRSRAHGAEGIVNFEPGLGVEIKSPEVAQRRIALHPVVVISHHASKHEQSRVVGFHNAGHGPR